MERCNRYFQLLVFLQLACKGLSVKQLEIKSPVKATASSTYKIGNEQILSFSPQLAIQADNSDVWANCFLSKKETNPWFRLQLKTVTSIFNVRLGVRMKSSGRMPAGFHLKGMHNLSVYVSRSAKLEINDENLCGSPWTYAPSDIIDMDCGGRLRGKFVYVTVPSSSPVYLIVCNIVLNRDAGSPQALKWSAEKVTFASSGFDSAYTPSLAIDDIPSSCSSITGSKTTWLRIDIRTVRYTREIRLLFPESTIARVAVYVGRSLQKNGAVGNEKCGTVSVTNNTTVSNWKNITCSQSVFGQFIYIESYNNSMKICELQVFYGSILDIYSPVRVTALSQKEEFNSIWKPIDGVFETAEESSWISLPSSQSWWRLELSHRSAVSKVVIYTPLFTGYLSDRKKLVSMRGFAVYVGDLAVGDGRSNKRCGEPWKPTLAHKITRICTGPFLGNYIYVTAADTPGAMLYLTEITVYGCEEPNIQILKSTLNQERPQTNLTCYSQASRASCPVKRIVWTHGNDTMNETASNLLKGMISSTVTLNGRSQGGNYTCTVHFKGGSAVKAYYYTGLSVSPAISTVTNKDTSEDIYSSISSKLSSSGGSASLSVPKSTLSSHVGSISGTLASWSVGNTSVRSTPALAPVKGSESVNVATIIVPITITVILVLVIFTCFWKKNRKCVMTQSAAFETEAVQHKPVAVADFKTHVELLHENENHGFSLEYSLIGRQASQHSTSIANTKCNKSKNRYPNILPYDHTRVSLKCLPGVNGSDYINASYIDGYCQPKGYIACQGPSDSTVADFWRMIWESNVQTIAVVTNFRSTSGKTKCSCYWPEVGYSANYGDITVKFEEELVLPDCTVRNFILVYYDEEPKSVTQFHFSGWPDHGVPTHATAFLNFINRVRDHQDHLATSSPMVVHCSAGVGRTGTFIVVDYSILWLKQENQMDIFNLVKEIRQQRPFLVQSLAQYIFCHDAILEVITCGDTSVESSNLRSYISIMKEIDQATGETGFAKQLKLLNRLIPPKECHVYPKIHENRKSANIYVSLDDSSVPENIPFQLSNSTWICATSADGRNLKRNSYITAQCPLKETVDDFWTLVWENDIELVVTLSRMEGNKETPMELNDVSAQYWPSEGTAEYNLVSVTLHDQKHMEDYAIRQFTVTDSEISRMVTQFHYKKWSSGTRNLPDHPSQLLHMISLLQKAQLQADNKTVVVISNNGVHQCGLFCAISIVVEFLKAQHRVDIFQVVKSLRIHNPVFITDLMEYEFCYDMALLFLETFTEKSTFKLV